MSIALRSFGLLFKLLRHINLFQRQESLILGSELFVMLKHQIDKFGAIDQAKITFALGKISCLVLLPHRLLEQLADARSQVNRLLILIRILFVELGAGGQILLQCEIGIVLGERRVTQVHVSRD